MTRSRLSVVTLGVEDVAAARRFYVDGLGWDPTLGFELDRPIAEVDAPCSLTSYFIQKDGLRVELLDYRSPGVFGTPRRPMNQLGLTHLSFRVDDVSATAARLVELGGTIVEGTRTTFAPTLDFFYCTDPDGVRVELMKLG